jgi:hypothetical protein
MSTSRILIILPSQDEKIPTKRKERPETKGIENWRKAYRIGPKA